jgi:hypothetical protein
VRKPLDGAVDRGEAAARGAAVREAAAVGAEVPEAAAAGAAGINAITDLVVRVAGTAPVTLAIRVAPAIRAIAAIRATPVTNVNRAIAAAVAARTKAVTVAKRMSISTITKPKKKRSTSIMVSGTRLTTAATKLTGHISRCQLPNISPASAAASTMAT